MVKFEETFLTEPERLVLAGLSHIATGLGVIGPHNDGWQKTAASLKSKGLLDKAMGCYSINDAGRSRLRSNR